MILTSTTLHFVAPLFFLLPSINFEFFFVEDLPDMLERCRTAQINDNPSPFGPLNARGCVCEPPCGGPPWPPLLPGPQKQKIRGRSGCHTFFSEISRPCAPYIRLRLRVFFDFDYFDYGFSPKMVITTALNRFRVFLF